MESTNIAANVNALGRPVMAKDIAEKMGLSIVTVRQCLGKNSAGFSEKTVQRVREVANLMGYDPAKGRWYGVGIHNQTVEKVKQAMASITKPETYVTMKTIAERLGISVATVMRAYSKKNHRNPELEELVRQAGEKLGYQPGRGGKFRYSNIPRPGHYWRNGNFATREAEITRMKELRAQGYTNAEIAKKIGRTPDTVVNNIGRQDKHLTLITMRLSHQRRAEAAAARAAYLRNKPIAEYNAKVDQANELKEAAAKALAAAEALHAELSQQQPAIEKLAAQKIPVPQIDLGSLQPTALQ